MTRLEVTREVTQAYPGLQIAAVVTSGFDGRRPWPELEARLAALEAGASRHPAGDPADDPHIAAWHAAYRAFGEIVQTAVKSLAGLLSERSRSVAAHQVTGAGPAIPAL